MRRVLSSLLCFVTAPAWASCEQVGWIQSVEDMGGTITLSDGSLWKVNPVDKVNSAIWLPMSDVSVCDGNQLLNHDEDESVLVTPLNRLGAAASSSAPRELPHEIEAVSNSETFIINGEVYKARTYCHGFLKGDWVIFTDGSPYGSCSTATFIHSITGAVCHLRCE